MQLKNTAAVERPSEHCVYAENTTDGNKCKPKAGIEPPEPGKGDGIAGEVATTGCARHQNQTDCKKDKRGDK